LIPLINEAAMSQSEMTFAIALFDDVMRALELFSARFCLFLRRIVGDNAESVGSQSLIRHREKCYKTASLAATQSQFLIDSSAS